MSRLMAAVLAVVVGAFLLPAQKAANENFLKYRPLESYEVQPGFIMFPSYSAEGQVCQIEIEKRLYSRGTVHLDPSVPRETLIQIVDQLVPPGERGPLAMNFGTEYISVYTGSSVRTFAEYQNVSVSIYGPSSTAGDVVAFVNWKNRACEQWKTVTPDGGYAP